MNPYFIGGTVGLLVAVMVIAAWLLSVSDSKRYKLFKLFRGKSAHQIAYDCSGQPLSVIVPLVHEQGVWFGEQNMMVEVELDWPSTIVYNMAQEGDVALFRLRWGGSDKYSFK